MENLRRKLKEIYEARGPFPSRSDIEAVDILWAEFVDYDAYIAGLIQRVILGMSLENYKLYFDEKLERKLIKIEKGNNPIASRDAKRILKRLTKIKKMVVLVQQIISNEQ